MTSPAHQPPDHPARTADPNDARPGRMRFGATHDLEQLATALAGYFDQGELLHLAGQVEKRRRWRGRRGKSTGPLTSLHRALTAAVEKVRPAPVGGMLHLFSSLDSETPMEVVLADGTVTTDIPQGVSFSLLAGSVSGHYFVEETKGVRAAIFLAPTHVATHDGADGMSVLSCSTNIRRN